MRPKPGFQRPWNSLCVGFFDEMDKNRDGKLDFTEFSNGWRWLGIDGSQAELKHTFSQLEEDGLISFENFEAHILQGRSDNSSLSRQIHQVVNDLSLYQRVYKNDAIRHIEKNNVLYFL